MNICSICNSQNIQISSQSSDVEYFTSSDIYTYYICYNCKSIFISSAPEDKLNTIYPSNYYSFKDNNKSFIEKAKLNLDKFYFKKILKKLSSPNPAILDIGGGSGWLLDLIKEVDPRINDTTEVDLNQNAGTIAKAKGHNYFCGKFEDFIPPENKKYDLIIALNFLEHVKNPEEVLLKMSKILNTNGRILLKTPNTDSLDARIFKSGYWGGLHCPRHWNLFNKDSLNLIVKNSNLMVENINYTQGAPFWAWSILYLLNKNKLITLNKNKPMGSHFLFKPLLVIFAIFDLVRSPFSKTSQMVATLKLSK